MPCAWLGNREFVCTLVILFDFCFSRSGKSGLSIRGGSLFGKRTRTRTWRKSRLSIRGGSLFGGRSMRALHAISRRASRAGFALFSFIFPLYFNKTPPNFPGALRAPDLLCFPLYFLCILNKSAPKIFRRTARAGFASFPFVFPLYSA